MRASALRRTAAAVVAAWAVAGCVPETIPREALALTPQSLERRQAQTRVFDTSDEERMLAAAAGVLQDLGFTIDESETDLGVIVSSKRRDARQADQVARSVVTTLVGAFFTLGTYWSASGPIDDVQEIRASLVTAPIGASGERMEARITFQRTVWNTDDEISLREEIYDPQIYQEFFDALSTSLFLEAHKI